MNGSEKRTDHNGGAVEKSSGQNDFAAGISANHPQPCDDADGDGDDLGTGAGTRQRKSAAGEIRPGAEAATAVVRNEKTPCRK